MPPTTETPKTSQMPHVVSAFLALQVTALPGASYLDDDDSWQRDPWSTLRSMAITGQSAVVTCGSRIIVSADRDGWRDGVVIA